MSTSWVMTITPTPLHQGVSVLRCAGDRDRLPLAARQEVDRPAVVVQHDVQRRQALACLHLSRGIIAPRQDAPVRLSRLTPERQILGDSEVRAEREILIRRRDPARLRVRGPVKLDGLPLDRDPPRVGARRTAQHADLGALACAVVADEADDLPCVHAETDVLHSLNRPEVLRQSFAGYDDLACPGRSARQRLWRRFRLGRGAVDLRSGASARVGTSSIDPRRGR